LYFILGVIVYLFLNKLGVSHKIIFTILICFAYACSDEFHQMFVDERTAKILDVFIDTIGSTCGIILSNIILNVLKKCKCDISNQCNA
jgi:VanZ family protein